MFGDQYPPGPASKRKERLLQPIDIPLDNPEEQSSDPRWLGLGLGKPIVEQPVYTQDTSRPGVCKNQLWDDEEGPHPVPFPGHRVGPQHNVDLEKGSSDPPQDRKEPQEERDAKEHLTEEGEVAERIEVG